eukprot:gene10337-975_t
MLLWTQGRADDALRVAEAPAVPPRIRGPLAELRGHIIAGRTPCAVLDD